MTALNSTPDLGFRHVYVAGSKDWTLLVLHGTGGDEHDLVGLGRRLVPDATLLSPRGKVLEGGMPRFFRRLAIGRLDIPDLIVRTDELAEFVIAATAEYKLDPARILALGFSNGANVAVSVLLRHPGLLRGAALLRPMLPYEPEETPILGGTEVLIDAGASDPHSSPEETRRLADILPSGGAAVTVHRTELRPQPDPERSWANGTLARHAHGRTELMGRTTNPDCLRWQVMR